MKQSNNKNSAWDAVYAAIFERAPEILPEFAFKPAPAGFIATTAHRTSGAVGTTPGKVYYYANNPGSLIDYTASPRAVSLWDYVTRRDNLHEPRDTARRLFELAGMEFKEAAPPEPDPLGDSWGELCAICAGALDESPEPRADAVRTYLKERRGFAAMFDQGNRGELGFYPGTEAARAALMGAGHTTDTVAAILQAIPRGAGTTHPLTIAVRNHQGRLVGVQFAAIDDEHRQERKYLNSKGMDKGEVYGVTRRAVANGPLILTEGLLDSYAARLHGFANVAALGGASLGESHVKAIAALGARDIYLCLDSDPAGRRATLAAIQALFSRDKFKIYVCALEWAKDVDELLRHPDGAKEFELTIKQADEVAAYLADHAREEIESIYNREASDDVQRGEAAQIAAKYFFYFNEARRDEADRYLNRVLNSEIAEILQLREGDVRQYILNERDNADRRRSEAILSDFIQRAGEIATEDARAPQKALKRLQGEMARATAAVMSGRNLVLTGARYTRQDFMREIASLGDGLQTGYTIGRAPLIIPPGVTIYAAATGHGKTWALINTILQAAKLNPDKTFHFFTYEMPRAQIALRFLSALHGKALASNNSRGALLAYLQGNRGAISEAHALELGESLEIFYSLTESGRLVLHDSSAAPDAVILAEMIKAIYEAEPVGAVAVDYIQLLRLPGEAMQGVSRRDEELKRICLMLGEAANGRMPVILASQFNREVKNPGDMAAGRLSEASDIEKIAALIVGFYNNAAATGDSHAPGTFDVRSLKVREGEPFSGGLEFCKHSGKFSNTNIKNSVI